jgi:hypothetical protein
MVLYINSPFRYLATRQPNGIGKFDHLSWLHQTDVWLTSDRVLKILIKISIARLLWALITEHIYVMLMVISVDISLCFDIKYLRKRHLGLFSASGNCLFTPFLSKWTIIRNERSLGEISQCRHLISRERRFFPGKNASPVLIAKEFNVTFRNL